MSKLASFALVALTAVAVVNGAAVFPRKNPPYGWVGGIMEPYDAYHTRYIAIRCQEKHNTQFFDDCCHPMKKDETLEKNRKAYCRPESPSSSPAPSPTSVPDEGDDNDDDDDDSNDNGDGNCEADPSSPAPAPAPAPSKTPEPTPSPSPAEPEPSSVKPSPTEDVKPSETPVNNPSSESHTGGQATWFDQNGIAGACGNVNPDSAFIVALDPTVWGDHNARSEHCGQKINLSWNGKSIQVTAADECPGCGPNSLDLSHAAFEAFASKDMGVLPGITWEFI